MSIQSATFFQAVTSEQTMVLDGLPQIAFIGRSNVGKSSVINAITRTKGLARSSSLPGATKEINFFLINHALYFVDLPGYGFAKGSHSHRSLIADRIAWYLNHEGILSQKIVLIVDAKVGPTKDDKEVLSLLDQSDVEIIIVANKTDKLKKVELQKSMMTIKSFAGPHAVIAFSSEKKIGIGELTAAVLAR